MPLYRHANNFTTALTADPGTTGTTLSVNSTAGLATPTAQPLNTGFSNTGSNTLGYSIIVDSEVMLVTAVPTATSLTVVRAQEGTAAAAHAVGATVAQIVSRDAMHYNPSPGGVNVTVPTGTVTYAPSGLYKYHFLSASGSTALTIAAPTAGVTPFEVGDELRFHLTIGGTAITSATIAATYDAGSGAPAFAFALTAGSRSSVSFAYFRGGTTNPLWRRIQ